MKSKTITKAEPTVSYLIFSVGEDRFAIEAMSVKRIAKWNPPIEMPGVKQRNIAITEVENETSMVFMLENLLPKKPSDFNYLIQVIHPKANVAVSATNVYELASVPVSSIQDTPKIIEDPDLQRVFGKSYIDSEGIVMIFDARQLKF